MDLARYLFATFLMWLTTYYVDFLDYFGVWGRHRGYVIGYIAAKYAYREHLIYIEGLGGEIWNIREQWAEKEKMRSIVGDARTNALRFKRELQSMTAS